MKLDVLNLDNKKTDVQISETTFGKEFNETLVHQAVVTYLAGSRQGSHKQKTRSEVRGGGKKPYRQKGTGRARAGTIRSPIWRGGGVAFAATPRDYSKKINKKMYRSAMRSIWSKLADENRLVAVNSIQIDEPAKASQVKNILSNLGLKTALIILSENNENLSKASKNLTECRVSTIKSIDPSALIQAEKVLITSDTLDKLTEVLS